ncbi:MAG TPA: DUF3253 domain-containing protein [Mycobacterium sp.]
MRQQQPNIELHRIIERAGTGVDDARVALGDGPVRVRLRAAIRALAVHRGRQSSTCPSDAARAVGGENWRELMYDARTLARELALSGDVEITQGGTVVDPRSEWSGPIRIRTADR